MPGQHPFPHPHHLTAAPSRRQPGWTVPGRRARRRMRRSHALPPAGVAHSTSCFLCAVRVQGHDSLQPACTMPAADGLVVTTESSEIQAARKTALELLFSDHAGRCEAPCAIGCPAHLDVPA